MTHGKPWARCQGAAIRVSQEGWKGTANEESNVSRFEEGCKGAADRRRVFRCANVDGGRGRALDGRGAAWSRIWGSSERAAAMYGSLCSGVLPDVGRVKACVQDKMGQLSKGCIDKVLDKIAGSSFKICKNQTYALCATARCNVYDGVAYCQCDVKHGDSISLPFPMGKDKDVCSVNAAGADSGCMISAYGLPRRLLRRREAARSTPARARALALMLSATADVLQKHRGDDVPGLRQPVPKGKIVCSCPIARPDRRRCARLSNPRALSLRQVLLPVLRSRHRHRQDGFDDLCRCSDWHGSGSGGPAQRQGPARQRVSGVSPR